MTQVTGPQRVVGLALLAVAVTVSATVVMLWQLRSRELRHAIAETETVARLLATNVDEAVRGVDLSLRNARDKLQLAEISGQKLERHAWQQDLTERLISAPQIRSLFIVDSQGLVVASSREDLGTDVSVADRAYFKAFQQARPLEPFFGGLSKGRSGQRWKIYLARGFKDARGAPAGLIVASLDSTYFERLFDLMQLDIDRKLALYLEDGTLFASHPSAERWLGRVAPEMMAPGRRPGSAQEIKVFPFSDEDGVRYTFAVSRAEHFPLLVGVGNNDGATTSGWQSYAGPIALGALLVSGIIIAAGLVLYGKQQREEKLAAALHEASRRASSLIATMMDAIVTVDHHMHIIAFNPAAERMFGWSADEMLGQPLDRLLADEVRLVHAEQMAGFAVAADERRAMSPRRSVMGVRRDGTRFPADSTISRALVDGQQQLTAALRDVTERKRAKVHLQEANEQLRKLADALQEVRETERIRIARELHDDLGQRLTGLKLDLAWLGDRLKRDGSNLGGEVDTIRSNLDRAMASARRIWTELQPVNLEDIGFGDAVDEVVRETVRRTGLLITAELPARAMVGHGHLATALFRVVQEAVHNIVRHAQATQAAVWLGVVGDNMVLTIVDDGQGFDPASRMGKGLGLVSMRERVRGLEGAFEIDSAPAAGTRLTVTLALTVLARDESLDQGEETV